MKLILIVPRQLRQLLVFYIRSDETLRRLAGVMQARTMHLIPRLKKNERVFVLLFLLRCKEVDDDDDKLSQRREKGRFERLLEKSHCLPATASYASERKRIMQTFPLVRVMYPGPSSLMPREKGDSLPHCADSFPSAECRDDGRDEATQFHTSD